MVVENAFSDCNGNSAFSAQELVGLINVIIWNKKPFMSFKCVSESRATSVCSSCSCLLSSERCLAMPYALNGTTFEWPVNPDGSFASRVVIQFM
jgi:hypothetical protein